MVSDDLSTDAGRRLDGNAAAGLLADCFCFDLTAAWIACAGCGSGAPLGSYPVYGMAMGAVVRCAACDTIVLRVSETRGRIWLDLRGSQCLRIEPAAASSE